MAYNVWLEVNGKKTEMSTLYEAKDGIPQYPTQFNIINPCVNA